MSNMVLQEDVNRAVQKACDIFRGAVAPEVYKDYVLTMLFLKYVSDVSIYDGDATSCLSRGRFKVPAESSFYYLYEHRDDKNIGALIDSALDKFEAANLGILSDEEGGIFCNISFNNGNLGETGERNVRLSKLLDVFYDVRFSLDKSHNDIAGDVYISLIEQFSVEAGRKAGDMFTPNEVSTLLAKLVKSAQGASICDPACGSGSLLIRAAREVGSADVSLYGQELNGSTCGLAMMNMILHGHDNAVIRWGDTLRNPKLKVGDALMKFDIVVSNPTFSLENWGAEEAEYDYYGRFWRGVPPKSKGDWAFISHMLEVANERGKVAVVVPHGVLFRGANEGRIRRRTVEDNQLEAVIGLSANLFYGTGIPVAIAIFNKAKHTSDVLFIDAAREFESIKNQNRLSRDGIDHIVEIYRSFAEGRLQAGVVEDKYAYIATYKEIVDNGYNLNISLYVDTCEEEPDVDIVAMQHEIDTLEAELAEVQAQIKDYLQELGY